MSANRDRDEEIFDTARELAADERAAYLAERCGQDADLRQRIEQMLAADAAASEFFKTHDAPSPTVILTDASRSPSIEKVGDRIGRHKLLQQIGEGGCGVVYMAEQEEPVRRRVALKVIKLGMDTKQVIARFEAERQALALMDHPNIAKVLDAGATETGRPFFVMELVRGTKITEFCDEKELPTQERLNLFLQVCSAIQHAHQKGIIHRDIKPSNILVTVVDGVPVPKVIDFGIAKATNNQPLTDKTVFTAFEQFIGTPAYMSPEQAELSGVDIDTRTDIYSLGVVLYELLTGSPPFDQKELLAAGLDEMRRTIRETEPPRPSNRLSTMTAAVLTATAHHRHTEPPKLVHLVRGDLDWIALKCLEKDRARRYETANALAADIRRHLDCEPVVARPPSRWYEFQKTVRRHKLGFAAATAVILVLAIGVLVSTLQAVRATRAEQEQSRLRQEAQQARAQAEVGEKKAEQSARSEGEQRKRAEQLAEQNRYNLYAARIKLAESQIKEGNANNGQRLLDGLRPQAGETDLRSFDWYYLWQLLHSERLSLAHKWHVLCLAYSPDGSLLATSGDDPVIHLWDISNGLERAQFVGHKSRVSTLAFAPDGKTLASAGADKTVRLWDLDQTNQFRILQTGTNEITTLAFSKDGRFLAWGEGGIPVGAGNPETMYSPPGSPGRVWIWHMAEDRLACSFIGQNNSVRCLAFSPDGRKLLSGGDDRSVTLHDSFTGDLLSVRTNFAGKVFGAVFSRDSKEAMVGVWSPYLTTGEILLLDGNSLERKRTLVTDAGQILCLAASRDGKKLATGGVDRTARVWDSTTGDETAKFQGPNEFACVAFAPDGKSLATGDWEGRVKTWSVETQPVRIQIPTLESLSVAYSPDGKLLVCSGQSVEVRDAASGKLLRVLPDHQGRGIRVAFSPDGSVLAAADASGAVHFWNTVSWDHWIGKDGDTQSEIKQVGWFDSHLAFFPDSQTLVVPGNDKIVRFWEVKTGALKETIEDYPNWIASVAMPDGQNLLTGGYDQLCFWDLKSKRITTCFEEPSQLLRVSGDRRWMVSGRFDLKLRNLRTKQVTGILQGHKTVVYSVAFSHDNRLLATASWDGTAKIWHVLSGQELLTIPSTAGLVWTVKFAPDDRSLAFGCSARGAVQAGEVVIIRAATEEKVKAYEGVIFSDPDALAKTCDEFGRNAKWNEALAALRKPIELEPTNHWLYHRLSPLLVAVGDTQGYRQASQKIQSLFGGGKDPHVGERMAKACLILPSSGVDSGTIAGWIEAALSASGDGVTSPWNQCVKALAEYRQGNFAAAAEWSEKATGDKTQSTALKIQAWMILAMGRWQLKQPDVARAALTSGTDVMEHVLPKIEDGDLGWDWVHWIAAHALHREACQLIEGHLPADPFERKL